MLDQKLGLLRGQGQLLDVDNIRHLGKTIDYCEYDKEFPSEQGRSVTKSKEM